MSRLGLEKLAPKGRRRHGGVFSATDIREIRTARKRGISWEQIYEALRKQHHPAGGLKDAHSFAAGVHSFIRTHHLNGNHQPAPQQRTVQRAVQRRRRRPKNVGLGVGLKRAENRAYLARTAQDPSDGLWPCPDCTSRCASDKSLMYHHAYHCPPTTVGPHQRVPLSQSHPRIRVLVENGQAQCLDCGGVYKNVATAKAHQYQYCKVSQKALDKAAELNKSESHKRVKRVRRRHGHGFRKVAVRTSPMTQPAVPA